MFKNMRLVILFDMLLNPSFKMTTSFANKFFNEIINLGINKEKTEYKRLSSSINRDTNN